MSRVFIWSSDTHFFQTVEAATPSLFDLQQFSSTENLFQNIHLLPDVIFIDQPIKGFPIEIYINRILDIAPNTFIVIVIPRLSINDSYDFFQWKIFDVLEKEHLTIPRLLHFLEKLKSFKLLQQKVKILNTNSISKKSKNWICYSNCMQQVNQLIQKAGDSNIPVLISGHPGTGKSTVAKMIHNQSTQKDQAFIQLDLSEQPLASIDEALFGSTTNATIGKLQAAGKGTLYIANINLLPASVQERFYHTLRDGYFFRNGDTTSIPFQARLIVSSCQNLLEARLEENFRDDLYHYLMGIPLHLPALHKRENDVLLMAHHFTSNFCNEHQLPTKTLTKAAKKKMLNHTFSENVRELKMVIEQACIMSDNDLIDSNDLEWKVTSEKFTFLEKEMTFEEYKSKIIHHYLEKYEHDILKVSNKLDIGKSTIYRMLKSEKEKKNRAPSWSHFF